MGSNRQGKFVNLAILGIMGMLHVLQVSKRQCGAHNEIRSLVYLGQSPRFMVRTIGGEGMCEIPLPTKWYFLRVSKIQAMDTGRWRKVTSPPYPKLPRRIFHILGHREAVLFGGLFERNHCE